MSSNLFVQFSDGVEGESEDEKHPGSDGWCEIIDVSFEIEQEEDTEDEGDEMTRIVTEPVKITKYVDTASPQLIQGCAKATPYAKVKIELLREGRHQ
jgi:type VI secretion system secreted protein Hcp